ncbi:MULTISPECIES: DUF2206 domain-containing protein [unclassified Haladaptatus]|uniref:DUF2206 domain-containing protein n=1 Tax=unclassified Haladaptatus TaxID=2622732 RepID=UPI0023E8EFCF|nr:MULTISPECIES: DUF2206 domain-containing protein [unclassified Haladaptatus]
MGRLRRMLAYRHLDRDAAVLGLLMAILLFPLRFFASQIYIKTIPLVLGTACILYLLTLRFEGGETVGHPTLPPGIARLLPSVVFTGIAALIMIASIFGGRVGLFMDVSAVIGTLILIQVLFAPDSDLRPRWMLIQILAFVGVLRLAALFTSPGYIGIDIWTHMEQIARPVYEQRSLSAISDNKHFAAPFFHLLVAGVAILFDVTLRDALYLSLGLAMPFAALLIYMTTRLLVATRWALFAAVMYGIGDYVIEWGMHLIPTSHGLLLFLGVLYAMVRVMQTEHELKDLALLLFFSVALILTHQVSSFIMMVVIGAAVVAQVILSIDLFSPTPVRPDVVSFTPAVNLSGLLVFDAGFITFMWSFTPYRGNSFLETVLNYLRETVADSAGFLNLASGGGGASGVVAGEGPTLIEQIAQYVDTVGFLLLLFVAIVGCLYVLRRERSRHSVFTLLIASVIMLVFVLGLPMFGIRNFIPQRWFAFLYAPLAIMGAIGVRHMSFNLYPKVVVAVMLIFVLVFPGMMLMSSHGAIDNPVFDDNRARLSYTEQELDAVHTVGTMTGRPDSEEILPNEVIYTDHPYQTVFFRSDTYMAGAATINDTDPVTHDVVMYRGAQSEKATFFRNFPEGSNTSVATIRDIPPERLCRTGMDNLYSNGDVMLCSNGAI